MDALQSTVAIVGASPKPERTSNLAVARYLEAGWTVWPIHPHAETIYDQTVYRSLEELPGRPEIISLYVRAELALPLIPKLAAANPDWIYCNPGADDPAVVSALKAAGLQPVVACNLVALSLGDPRSIATKHS